MSIITPSRAELLPIHRPHFSPLHSSLMPALSPSMSPHPVAPFAPPQKLERSRLDRLGAEQYNVIKSWKKTVDNVPRATSSARAALAEVKPNIHLSVNTASRLSGLTSKPSNRTSAANSIPRPVATPDVFAPCSYTSFPLQSTALSTPPGKRSRETAAASLFQAKRARVDVKRESAEATARNHKSEEERWKAKWIKVFPTLVFHFEIGAEEGQGKLLVGRVVRMGAVRIPSLCKTRCDD